MWFHLCTGKEKEAKAERKGRKMSDSFEKSQSEIFVGTPTCLPGVCVNFSYRVGGRGTVVTT